MIKYDENKRIWLLETNSTSYALGLSERGTLLNIHFGEKLPYFSDYPQAQAHRTQGFTHEDALSPEEYMAWCMPKYTEPCIKATFHDDVRDVVLVYEDYAIHDNRLTIGMMDSYYPFKVKLIYAVYEDCDIIEKKVEVINCGKEPIMLEQVLSGSMYPPRVDNYRLSYLSGKWGAEFQLDRVMLSNTKYIMESKRGTTSHFMNPFFMLDENGKANEEYGNVYYGALAFSGNWKMTFEKDHYRMIKVCAGINDFDFQWHLKAGETFYAPSFIMGFSSEGFGKASRNLHRYQLQYVLPKHYRTQPRKILYNSWEDTGFTVNEEQQCELAGVAASIGIELFVMDDGWFGKRINSQAGLGDWVPNKDKFPNGLDRLINHVNSLGMDFGLWVEPEMVNPDSDLYRAHPDWAYHFPTRTSTLMRNQLVLNLAREDVRQFIFDFMDSLLSQHNIKFIKWDMNRNFSEPGYPSAPIEEQREIWVRHATGVYEIVEKLKQKHPDVIFQSCSGGGGRIDFGILRYFDQVWTSDNTDTFDRLFIQEGFSYAYCAKIMEAWVTNEINWLTKRKLPMQYRFHSCMMGNLGIGDNLMNWGEEEKEKAREYINIYKEIRHIVQHGVQYRLLSPREGNVAAVMYVTESKEEGVLFIFLHSTHFDDDFSPIYLRGLEESALYEIDGMDFPLSGKALMSIGVTISLQGDFDSRLLRIRKVGI